MQAIGTFTAELCAVKQALTAQSAEQASALTQHVTHELRSKQTALAQQLNEELSSLKTLVESQRREQELLRTALLQSMAAELSGLKTAFLQQAKEFAGTSLVMKEQLEEMKRMQQMQHDNLPMCMQLYMPSVHSARL